MYEKVYCELLYSIKVCMFTEVFRRPKRHKIMCLRLLCIDCGGTSKIYLI